MLGHYLLTHSAWPRASVPVRDVSVIAPLPSGLPVQAQFFLGLGGAGSPGASIAPSPVSPFWTTIWPKGELWCARCLRASGQGQGPLGKPFPSSPFPSESIPRPTPLRDGPVSNSNCASQPRRGLRLAALCCLLSVLVPFALLN